MRITGSHTLGAPRERVWEALQDPAVLVRTLPGCRQLEATGPDEYTATVAAGVASIKGVYTGRVALSEQEPPSAYTLKASGQGGPGTIDATARITLADADDGATTVHYDADAAVGGQIAGVGQRVLAGVAKRNAAAFFTAVERELTAPAEAAPVEEAPSEQAPVAAAPEAAAPATPAAGRVYRAPEPEPAAVEDPRWLLVAGVVGAFIALAGVLVGRRTR